MPEERPERRDPVALLRSIYDPLERGESTDFGPFYDALAEDAVLTTPVGEVRGKQAVIGYFANAAATLEFDPFVRPLSYFAAGNRVVQLGEETWTVKATGKTTQGDAWAWVFDVEDGRITRILAIQRLAGVADEIAEALAKAQQEAGTPGTS
jgi:ketosteroid isomerase-like protein